MNLKKNQIPKQLFVKVYMTPFSKVSQSFPIPKRKKKVKTIVDLIVEIGNCTVHVLMLNVKKKM